MDKPKYKIGTEFYDPSGMGTIVKVYRIVVLSYPDEPMLAYVLSTKIVVTEPQLEKEYIVMEEYCDEGEPMSAALSNAEFLKGIDDSLKEK